MDLARSGSDLALLWLWLWLAAVALIWPLPWEPPYAVGVTLKKHTKKNLFKITFPVCLGGIKLALIFWGVRGKRVYFFKIECINTEWLFQVWYCSSVFDVSSVPQSRKVTSLQKRNVWYCKGKAVHISRSYFLSLSTCPVSSATFTLTVSYSANQIASQLSPLLV